MFVWSAPHPQIKILGKSWHFELSWSGVPYPPPPPPPIENLGRSWHFEFELVWSMPHPFENENLGRSWHFEFELVRSTPPPPEFQGACMWRLISVSPVDTISFALFYVIIEFLERKRHFVFLEKQSPTRIFSNVH